MAGKKNKNESVAVELLFPRFAGYADYFFSAPARIRVRNDGAETVTVTVTAESPEGLVAAYEEETEIPAETAVELPSVAFSPVFLADLDAVTPASAEVTVRVDGKTAAAARADVTALPFDWWEGLSGNPERIATFVRPRIADCAAVLAEAGKKLKKWNRDAEFCGYTGADKNAVRQVAAAVYAALKQYGFVRREACDLTAPSSAVRPVSLLKERATTSFELAVFACACLEAARLHPVLAVGKDTLGVGVWLYDSCFLDSVTDDAEIVGKYVSDGINNLSFFDVEDLFSERAAAFTPSEAHFAQKLKEGYYECFVDVKRCRLGGVAACPVRGKGLHGYELYREEDLGDESAPAPLREVRKLSLDGKLPRNRQWERRLLDLTGKNALLNFAGKNALHLASAGTDELYAALLARGSARLKASGAEGVPFGASVGAQERELLLLEEKKGVFRVLADAKSAAETAQRLMRRNREADEETGAKILYLALGFLRYVSKEDGAPRYAPLVLIPVGLGRSKGNEDFSVSAAEGEHFVNNTLLEFLKQEFNIDVRGLGGDVSALRVSEILAMVRAEVAPMKGWDVVGDVYLSAFGFQNYLLWNDLRHHIDELSKNGLVSALLSGRAERGEFPAPAPEDEADPERVLLPLPSDSSQYDAVALSATGASFVLHGPPGTGKSQTITNIVANALSDGKRVLFVAEKKAALDVVKKRLDAIGIGEFCLELHSNKTDKADVLRRMEATLALAGSEGESGFGERGRELTALREELAAPMRALHEKRRMGVSVYQAILEYLKNKNAPDVMDIESSFYDTLTEAKLSKCRSMILSAASAAKECGGVFRSPFENVNLTEYSQELRDRVFCACEVILAEIKHLRSFLGLFLEFYRQRVSTLTRRKLRALSDLARGLASDVYAKYFAGADEGDFCLFYNANRRLDSLLEYYGKHFKALVEPEDADELAKYLDGEGDWKLSKAARATVKRLSKVALHPVADEDVPKYLQTLLEIKAAEARVTGLPALAKAFTDRGGKINYKKRAEYLSDLGELHARCAAVFMDYNPDAFNGMCIRAANGYTRPVLEGYLKATESYFLAEESFLSVTAADRDKLREEDVLDYFASKASALIDNIDMLPNWCMYKRTAKELAASGLNFVTDSLESGRLKVENVLAGFEKNVYKNFLEINVPADPVLSRMTVGTLEETVEKFRLAWEEFSRLSRDCIRARLISRLPKADGEGPLSVELAAFTRLSKSNLRGSGLRGLFAEVPTLAGVVAPCLLMSPTTVAQYLQPVANAFDLVIFDEASQMSTAEAIGSVARAKAAIVVGDPKQLPPTAFFHSNAVDEENLENEDLESVLDDCLALGMPERHLLWHYRSKHESLIAFSNSMYYDNRLCTFPSPDALESKVRLVAVDGVYDRGFTKRNRKEAEALVKEVIRRLSDPVLSRSSMGVVTFSSAQRDDVERLLAKEIARRKLESVAYDGEEPLFVKNLENVQGDERDVILFSVCYGPDATGRVSLNFGPLNQTGGWRRLNVAVSRAREEMLVFSTMTAGMIDLAKTSSRGVAGLKAFLEFAERGKTSLAVRAQSVRGGAGIGKFIAAELSGYGYDCRYDVGASDFKVDVAVVDPRNRHRFILAVLCDGTDRFSVRDRNVLQVQTLKRGNWNVVRVNSVNYYNNPKREIKRIKDLLDRLTGAERKPDAWIAKYKRPYRAVKATASETAAFVTGGENDAAIAARLKEIVAAEEPISRAFLRRRCLATFGILKSGSRVESCLDALIDGCAFRRDRAAGVDYFYKNPRALEIGKFRVEQEGSAVRKTEDDYTVYEIVSLVKAALGERVALYMDELVALAAGVFRELRPGERFAAFLRECVAYGESKGIFVRSVSDRISLA